MAERNDAIGAALDTAARAVMAHYGWSEGDLCPQCEGPPVPVWLMQDTVLWECACGLPTGDNDGPGPRLAHEHGDATMADRAYLDARRALNERYMEEGGLPSGLLACLGSGLAHVLATFLWQSHKSPAEVDAMPTRFGHQLHENTVEFIRYKEAEADETGPLMAHGGIDA